MAGQKRYTVEEAAELIKQQILFDANEAKTPAGDAKMWEILKDFKVTKHGILIPLKGGGNISIPEMVLTFREADVR